MNLLLAIIGSFIGTLVNLAIFRLGYKKSNYSPWNKAASAHPRKSMHFIPIVGWLLRRNETDAEGRRYWARPFAIEVFMSLGLPLFYQWQIAFGLTGGVAAPVGWTTIWFVGHSILIVILIVATFIDFDQRVIPDSITVTGALIALIIAASFPSFRLPVVTTNLAGQTAIPLDFADGATKPMWHLTSTGMGIGIGIFWIWILALLPKMPLMALNWKSIEMVFISTIRLLKKNNLKARQKSRRIGWSFILLGIAGSGLLVAAWRTLPAPNLDSLFGALVGLGFGGLMLWSVRIVASHSLGQEAMGFGDVTLMAMIGAFLGWQTSLLTFAFSPFAALGIVLASFIATKQNELAFGPYLCLGAVITLFGWPSIWPWAERQFFAIPLVLIGVLAFSLLMLAVMMRIVRRLKGI